MRRTSFILLALLLCGMATRQLPVHSEHVALHLLHNIHDFHTHSH